MITKSSRESRGELTLLGNGPGFFIHHEPVFDGVSGEFDGVPTRTMKKTPSDPIVVVDSAVVAGSSATVDEAPAPRRESVVSARFFAEGERQELLGWKDSPLVDDTVVIPAVQFSSFDRVPRRRAPLVLTMATAVGAAIVGFGALGMGAGVAHALLTTQTGKQATVAWNRAKTELSGKLTARTHAAAQATRAPVTPLAATKPVPAPDAVAAAAPVAPAPTDAPAAMDSSATRVAAAPVAEAPVPAPVKQRRHVAAVTRPQRGLVWSPTEHKVTVAQPPSSWEQAQEQMQEMQRGAEDAPAAAAPSAETGSHAAD
ncbi:MAG TPA: hypothetical protein VGP07_00255 [Polyangia bacterium]|jgi:hypothetical protein